MNTIATLLRERSLQTAFPLELPELEDIIEAQEAMLIRIPVEMRDYMLTSSDAIYGSMEPVTVADKNSHTYLPEVAAQAWADGMPRELLPLCANGEQIYCVDEEGSVFEWCISMGEDCQPVCDDVWQWIRDIWLCIEGEEL